MAAKASFVFCVAALFVQSVYTACLGGVTAPYAGAGFGYNGLAGGYGAGCGRTGVASTGGGLPVASASPIAPVGVSVLSENIYEGTLAAGGNLPFLGSVGIEGMLPTAGAGAVSYGCGDGAVAIGSEGPIATGIAVPGSIFPPSSPSSAATADALSLVPGIAGFGYNGVGYNGVGYNGLGYNGVGCNDLGYNGLGYKGVGCNDLEYNGVGYNGLGYNGVGCNDLGYNGVGYNGLNTRFGHGCAEFGYGSIGYNRAGCGCGTTF